MVTTRRKAEPDYDGDYDDGDGDEEYEDDDTYYEEPQSRRSSASNVVDINSKSRSNNAKVVLMKPTRYDPKTVSDIAQHVNRKRLVLLNLELTGKSDALRMIDFLSGVAFANNGKITKVANDTFFIVPHDYDLTGDMLEGFKTGFSGI
ncbi:MAG: cell division protein SepF [Clostridia bacterium]|nr:cell division protein SepF [Clostridia bacterium]